MPGLCADACLRWLHHPHARAPAAGVRDGRLGDRGTGPSGRRVAVTTEPDPIDVLAAAGVPDLLDEAERLRDLVHRQTHVVPDPAIK